MFLGMVRNALAAPADDRRSSSRASLGRAADLTHRSVLDPNNILIAPSSAPFVVGLACSSPCRSDSS